MTHNVLAFLVTRSLHVTHSRHRFKLKGDQQVFHWAMSDGPHNGSHISGLCPVLVIPWSFKGVSGSMTIACGVVARQSILHSGHFPRACMLFQPPSTFELFPRFLDPLRHIITYITYTECSFDSRRDFSHREMSQNTQLPLISEQTAIADRRALLQTHAPGAPRLQRASRAMAFQKRSPCRYSHRRETCCHWVIHPSTQKGQRRCKPHLERTCLRTPCRARG
jgi:hypothetical protein